MCGGGGRIDSSYLDPRTAQRDPLPGQAAARWRRRLQVVEGSRRLLQATRIVGDFGSTSGSQNHQPGDIPCSSSIRGAL
jgi:hypothetical protein